MISLPRIRNLSSCNPAIPSYLALELKKIGFKLNPTPRSLYQCIARATTGVTISAPKEKKYIEEKAAVSKAFIQKQKYYKSLQNPNILENEAYETYITQAIREGDPLLLHLWAVGNRAVVHLVCEGVDGNLGVYFRNSRSSKLTKPFCLAWVRDNSDRVCFMNVERIVTDVDAEDVPIIIDTQKNESGIEISPKAKDSEKEISPKATDSEKETQTKSLMEIIFGDGGADSDSD